METFLSEVAQQLRNEHPSDLDQVIVVFNNRRSGLFLNRQFSQMGGEAFFLPRVIGIDQLVSELGGLQIVPNEFLLFELFDIHRQLSNDGRKFETFEEFISFGEIMLSDFTEIDLYCADAHQLFCNLHDLKAMDAWDVEAGGLTPFQEKYLSFYQSLYQYYEQLRQRLSDQHKAYGGMAYRQVAENIDSLVGRIRCNQIYFVGFNALSVCEKRIIQCFVRRGIGRLITDGDAYYYDDEHQEAGRFLRKLKNDFSDIGGYKEHFSIGHKKITITKCSENILQCKYAGQILANQVRQNADDPIEQTAVVLADEKLLLPVLNALPSEIKTANVTMGFPFSHTAVHTLALKLLSLHQRRHGAYFYHQDIRDVLTDYCIGKLLGADDRHSRLTAAMVAEHIIYADGSTVQALCQKIGIDFCTISFLFAAETPDPTAWLELIRKLTGLLYSSEALRCNAKDQEALVCLLEITDYFEGLQDQYHFIDNLSVLTKIYTRLAQRRSVAFYGEPLNGLQILGMLETRNLDFRRVILLSANEGILPSGLSANTLIPFSLKKHFGIPTYHEKDAVYAYNFYRLLQRADEVHILVNTESDGMGKGEPSRFVMQLQRELAERYPDHIGLRQEVLATANRSEQLTPTDSVAKDESVMQRLESLADKGFSPSALNQYRGCPMKFYYEYILSLREKDDIEDDLAQNEVGSIIHKVLEKAYPADPNRPVPVTEKMLDDALSSLDELLAQASSSEYRHGRSREGRNHFFESVAKSQLTRFLNDEKKRIQQGNSLSIVSTETPVSHPIPIHDNPFFTTARISGVIDRIDIYNECLRIIDYKTGRVTASELKVANADPDLAEVPDKWFQVMLYAWAYSRKTSNTLLLQSGIFPLRHLGADLMPTSWGGASLISPEQINAFEILLKQLIQELLNPQVPFIAKHDSKLCQVCPFAETCQQSS